ncbi:MAG: hypothetical protein ACLQU5_28410 [Isosphaeraceae bacterium]
MSDFLSSQGRCGTMGRFFSLVACPAWAAAAAPVAAFIVGFAVDFAYAKIGLIAPVIPTPNRADVL